MRAARSMTSPTGQRSVDDAAATGGERHRGIGQHRAYGEREAGRARRLIGARAGAARKRPDDRPVGKALDVGAEARELVPDANRIATGCRANRLGEGCLLALGARSFAVGASGERLGLREHDRKEALFAGGEARRAARLRRRRSPTEPRRRAGASPPHSRRVAPDGSFESIRATSSSRAAGTGTSSPSRGDVLEQDLGEDRHHVCRRRRRPGPRGTRRARSRAAKTSARASTSRVAARLLGRHVRGVPSAVPGARALGRVVEARDAEVEDLHTRRDRASRKRFDGLMSR